MKLERTLVALVIADIVLSISPIIADIAFANTLPDVLRPYVWPSGEGWPSLRGLLALQLWAVTIGTTMAAWIGLLNFWKVARPLYLIAWGAFLMLGMVTGPAVSTAPGAMLQTLGALVGGAIMSLVYCSDLKHRFERRAATTWSPSEAAPHAV